MKMGIRSKGTIENGIPWYRDIHLATKQITVGRVCLECGDIIGNELDGNNLRQRHKECQKKHRARRQLKFNHKINPPKQWEPKHCVDCGVLLPETKWRVKNANRCDWHQFQRTKKLQKKWGRCRGDREYIVLATCIHCGELFECHHKNTYYCPEHRNCYKGQFEDSEPVDLEKRKEQTKEYENKVVSKSIREQEGTYDTAIFKGSVPITDVSVKDFDKEAEFVKHLKQKTLKKKKDLYSPTEGDYIRGDTYINKEKNGER